MNDPAMRRADFMMVLAYASDLATGQTRDFALRACVLAMRLARAARLEEREHRAVFHQSLLRYIGCNADTHLLVAAFGDEFVLRRDVAKTNLGDLAERRALFVRAFTRLNQGLPPDEMAKVLEASLPQAPLVTIPVLSGHCEVAQRIGARLGLPEEICTNLGQLYERWDGRGMPHGIAGEAVKLAVRLVTLAQDAVIQAEALGVEGMADIIAARRDGPYEAALADVLLADHRRLMDGLDDEIGRDSILSLEPQPHAMMDEENCEEAYLAIADMIDMRMPCTMGHSRAVAALADAAARHMKLPDKDVRCVRWAAYVHDIGELAMPVADWLKAKPFARREIDEMHLHPYHGERALAALGGGDGQSVAALVLRFQEDPDTRLLIANPAAAGTGFTLTAASYTVYESLSWRYDHYAQSQDRNHRIGQTQPVTYVRLIAADTIEEAVVTALERKSSLARSLLGDQGAGELHPRQPDRRRQGGADDHCDAE